MEVIIWSVTLISTLLLLSLLIYHKLYVRLLLFLLANIISIVGFIRAILMLISWPTSSHVMPNTIIVKTSTRRKTRSFKLSAITRKWRHCVSIRALDRDNGCFWNLFSIQSSVLWVDRLLLYLTFWLSERSHLHATASAISLSTDCFRWSD